MEFFGPDQEERWPTGLEPATSGVTVRPDGIGDSKQIECLWTNPRAPYGQATSWGAQAAALIGRSAPPTPAPYEPSRVELIGTSRK